MILEPISFILWNWAILCTMNWILTRRMPKSAVTGQDCLLGATRDKRMEKCWDSQTRTRPRQYLAGRWRRRRRHGRRVYGWTRTTDTRSAVLDRVCWRFLLDSNLT